MCFKKQVMWTIIPILGIAQLADAAFIRCYGDSLEKFDAVPLDQATPILNSSYYNSSYLNVLYAFGYNGKVNGSSTNITLIALIGLKYTNVFLLDWMEEAKSTDGLGDVGIMAEYVTKAIPKSMVVAKQLGAALLNMRNDGFNLTNLHLIGFSLGAHLLANTGRYIINNGNGEIINRITGLDPAGPVYQSNLSTSIGLDKTCAKFVDALHTDPGGYGINASRAHVDIWPNFIKFITGTKQEQVQPGCLIGAFAFMSPEDICSHDRSVRLMAEAWTLNRTLQASKAPNYYAWAAGNATTVITLGVDIDRNARGDFFLVTNAESPFGKGSDGLHET